MVKRVEKLKNDAKKQNEIMKEIVDILLVTYNQAHYIQQALDGILKQQINDNIKLRIIVADDCSSDETLSIIQQRLGDSIVKLDAGKEADVEYLYEEKNIGHVRNYQRAFAECKGDYVAIIEGDDYWNNVNHLQSRIDFMTNHPECVLTTQCPVWYYEDEKRFEMRENIYVEDPGYRAIPLRDEIYDNQITNLSSCVVRGDALRNINERVFTCSILDWPLYIDLYRFGLLYVLSGTTNVYRSSNKGIYSGLDDEGKKQARVKYINEMALIFPQYEKYFMDAKERLTPKKKNKSKSRMLAETLLTPFAVCHRFCKRIHKIYKQML